MILGTRDHGRWAGTRAPPTANDSQSGSARSVSVNDNDNDNWQQEVVAQRERLTIPIKDLLVNKVPLVQITTSITPKCGDHLGTVSSSASNGNGIEAASISDSEISSTLDRGGQPTVSHRPLAVLRGRVCFASAPFV
eukprot:g25634.t1